MDNGFMLDTMRESLAPATIDREGKRVTVGSVVRVLAIHPSIINYVEPEEKPRVQSMLGDELLVYEVDAWGRAWVDKCWHEDQDRSVSHSLGLAPEDMELVR